MSKSAPLMTEAEIALRRTLAERMVIIDGAMGTTIRSYNITEAQARGAHIVDGLGMLLHQGAPGFERWFGQRPEVDEATRNAVLSL